MKGMKNYKYKVETSLSKEYTVSKNENKEILQSKGETM